MNKLGWGIFWIVLGTAMLIFDIFYKEWFTINFTYFKLPIGILLIFYGIIHIVYYFFLQRALQFKDEELRLYGKKLENAAPDIVDMLNNKLSAKEIADEILKKYNIPQIITLKYIITLANEIKKMKKNTN